MIPPVPSDLSERPLRRFLDALRNALPYGTHTPVLTNVTNISASTAYSCQWQQAGNVVSMSGIFDVDAIAAGATEIGISLPVPSNLTALNQLAGTAVAFGGGEPASITGDAANNRASVQWVAANLANHTVSFYLSYRVL